MTLKSIFCLESWQRPKRDWFVESAGRLREAAPKRSAIAEACARVLGGYVPRGTKECISGTTNTANLVKQRESGEMRVGASKFLESYSPQALTSQTRFRVVLLEEGLGNFSDAYYYTRQALESAASVFTGLKIMADHPSIIEEQTRPERSTRDILGHYENLRIENGDGGRAWLVGDVSILPSDDCAWARARMYRAIENAHKFPDKPFIGLSINASGDSSKSSIDDVIAIAPNGARAKLIEAKDKGIELVKVVHLITSATSCDLVTEAGAGGKILNTIGDSIDVETQAG